MNGKPLILFDGVCNLCNGFVNFVIQRDHKNIFQFGSLQSPAVKELLTGFHYTTSTLSTVVLLENNKLFTESTAVLRILRQLGGGWKLLYGFIILPAFLRDFFYNLIARNRYFLFGKKDTCMIPTPALRAKFIE